MQLSVSTCPWRRRKNLESMIDQIQKQCPDCQVILQVMNPVVGKPKGDFSHREDLPAYQQMYRDVGRERGLLVIDHMPAWQCFWTRAKRSSASTCRMAFIPAAPGAESL